MECYEEDICYRLTGAPYVYNGCEQKYKCRKIKYYYYAKFANDEYSENLRTSRFIKSLGNTIKGRKWHHSCYLPFIAFFIIYVVAYQPSSYTELLPRQRLMLKIL